MQVALEDSSKLEFGLETLFLVWTWTRLRRIGIFTQTLVLFLLSKFLV